MKRAAAVVIVLVVGVSLGRGLVGWAAPTDGSSEPATTEQTGPTEASPAAADPDAPAGTETQEATAPAAESAPAQEGMISIDFKDADIRQVLRIISLKSGVDIVAGTDVEGLVTIKLTNVPWEQALAIILRTYGFTYSREGNIVRVMTVESLEQEALATEVFPLDYAKAKEVPDVIKEMLSDRGKVKFDERTNTIIVTDIPANLFQIQEVVERLDQRTPQVVIESKVVETKLEKTENLGIDWSNSLTLTAATATAPTTFPFPAGKELGAFGAALIPRAGTFSPTAGASLTKGRIPETGGTFTFGTLSSSGFSVVMNFLQSRTDTNIVSNPTIAVLNNQEAKIHIGEEYPVPSYTVDPTTGRTSISGYTPKQTGTVLVVTPHVNPSAEIVVDLKPEIITVGQNVTYSLGSVSGDISFPRFTTQTAKTSVRIGNGQTIAIGGLVKKSDAKVEAKVPFLGDIPIVGFLFKTTSRNVGSSDPVLQDLVIFLTVKLMEEEASAQAVATAPPPEGSYP